MKTFLFLFATLLSLSVSGQKCDPSFMFEKIIRPDRPFTLLKPYAIPVREIQGAPFSVQYSYLFEKGAVYGFYLKSIGKSALPVNLKLTNSENLIMKLDTLENYKEDGLLLTFMPQENDAYNLHLYSNQSFEGCLVFYVWVNRLQTKQTKDGWNVTLPTASKSAPVRRTIEKDSVLRKFEFRPSSSSRHAIKLVEGQLYGLQISDDQSAKILNVHIGSGHTDASINTHIVPQEKGYILYIRSSESGVHAFDFLNQSKDKSAVAILTIATERGGLPK